MHFSLITSIAFPGFFTPSSWCCTSWAQTHTHGIHCLEVSRPTPAATAIPAGNIYCGCQSRLTEISLTICFSSLIKHIIINKILMQTYSISSLTLPVVFQHLNSRELHRCCGITAVINLQEISGAWAPWPFKKWFLLVKSKRVNSSLPVQWRADFFQ